MIVEITRAIVVGFFVALTLCIGGHYVVKYHHVFTRPELRLVRYACGVLFIAIGLLPYCCAAGDWTAFIAFAAASAGAGIGTGTSYYADLCREARARAEDLADGGFSIDQ